MHPSIPLLTSIALISITTLASPAPLRLEITISEPTSQKQAPTFQDDEWYVHFCDDKPDGSYYHPEHCSLIAMCTDGAPSVRRCPVCAPIDTQSFPAGRLHYDEPSDECVPADRSRCAGPEMETGLENTISETNFLPPLPPHQAPIIQATTVQVDTDLTGFCDGKANGNYYHPDHCSMFITCDYGYADERNCSGCWPIDANKCPAGRTHFDEILDACLRADLARCSGPERESGMKREGGGCL